jgi:hypothetical protein
MYYSTRTRSFFTKSRIQGLILLALLIFAVVVSN